MASCASTGRIMLQTLACILTLFGVALTAAALFTPYWTTVDITQPRQTHAHGLWEDCVKGERAALKASDWVCSYKEWTSHYDDHQNMFLQQQQGFQNANFNANKGHHHGEPWVLTVLCLIVTAAFLGLLSLFFSCCSGCWKGCAIVWNVFTLLAALTSMIGVIVFIRNANDPKNKFLLSGTETAEQKLSYSFWLAVGGCISFVVSTLISILATILIMCCQWDRKVHESSSWPKGTKNTVI